MRKLTQRELLIEGFIDNIRKFTRPAAAAAAGVIGAAKGIAQTVAPKTYGEIKGDIDKLKGIKQKAREGIQGEKNRQRRHLALDRKVDSMLENYAFIRASVNGNPEPLRIGSKRADGSRIGTIHVIRFEYDENGNKVPEGTGVGRPDTKRHRFVFVIDKNQNVSSITKYRPNPQVTR